VVEITRMKERGLAPLEMQKAERARATEALDALQPQGARDLDVAFSKEPALVSEAANGRTANAIRQLQLEAELRTNPQLRADAFADEWNSRAQKFQALKRDGYDARAERVRDSMRELARQLQRDPQIESLLREQKRLIGMSSGGTEALSRDVQEWLGRSRGIGMGM
jgi:cell fate (sporulation/competence/biofilm development) regulator YlbF (YheA/YmcA/DUF963 family)